MKRVIALMASVVLLASCGVFADDSRALTEESQVTFQWTPPTERVNGRPLDPVTEIASYALRCTEVDGDKVFNTDLPGFVSEGEYVTTIGELLPEYGYYNCALAAVDTFGLYSDYVVAVGEDGSAIEFIPARPSSPFNVNFSF